MYKGVYKFVGHSKGDFEGTEYDNVMFSDGLQTAKFRNDTGIRVFSDYKRGESVEIGFTLEFGKTGIKPVLVSISLI